MSPCILSSSSRAALLAAVGLLPLPGSADNALASDQLGPYNASEFHLANGDCRDCPAPPAALWYFRDQTIAVPNSGVPVSGYDPRLPLKDDARQARGTSRHGRPSLIWLAAPTVLPSARLGQNNRLTLPDGQQIDWLLTGRLDSNRSWYNRSSANFFRQGTLKIRGTQTNDQPFIARTIWPRNLALPPAMPLQPLHNNESIEQLVRAEQGGAQRPFQTRLLWSRGPASLANWAGKATLAVMLNGAQGDDDEAHGGHFALTTGRIRPDGDMSDWLVNNFYSLDIFSEKGITAATLPLDSYLADLNSGQQWYRPSYMVVAVLRDAGAALQVQDALNRVMQRFYRHDLVYNHAQLNCTGLSMDTLRALGWNVPNVGNSGRLAAAGSFTLSALSNFSIDKGMDSYRYMQAELTRLLPAVAFRETATDVLRLAQRRTGRMHSSYEQALANNLEAVIFVRFPQFPSSRKWGQAPVFSNTEYAKRTPLSRSNWQILPVAKRPFPSALRQ